MAYLDVTSLWVVTNTAAGAAAASASKAAAAAGVRHVAKRALVSVATVAATAQTPVLVNLRDGATAAGTVLVSWQLAAIGTTFAMLDVDNLSLIGTAATAMTLEFNAATVANAANSCTLIGYDN